MPYSSVTQVPDVVPKDQRNNWLKVFNSAYQTARSKGKSDEDAESYAFAVAHSRFGPHGKYIGKSAAAWEFTRAGDIRWCVRCGSSFFSDPAMARHIGRSHWDE